MALSKTSFERETSAFVLNFTRIKFTESAFVVSNFSQSMCALGKNKKHWFQTPLCRPFLWMSIKSKKVKFL